MDGQEIKLVEKIKELILELGYGFAFIGNQYKISAGTKDYYLDLLFYHRKLKCLVCFELKTGEFKAEYALRGINKPMGVSEYSLTKELPNKLRGALPTLEELKKEVI